MDGHSCANCWLPSPLYPLVSSSPFSGGFNFFHFTFHQNLALLYFVLGVLVAGDNMLYSVGLLYLSASTYSLICATQLAFNAVFSYFLNSQKFTALILNSVVTLSLSAALIAVNDNSDGPSGVPKEMQIYTSVVASCLSTIGLFASGEWKSLQHEMEVFGTGSVSYVLTLVWTAISWQVCAVGVVGLIFVVSSLFSNFISTLSLAVTPLAGVSQESLSAQRHRAQTQA
ncbi:hypothetical protein ERO13_A12G125401v2 [Gossypium hirsutum]|nr:hypothetical protein ERO13_A12G125401v2 [Gossypium hirsutum]